VGRLGVANMKLHSLADSHEVRDSQGAGFAVQPQHVPHQEIAALEFGLILVDDLADVESLLKELLLLGAQLLPELLQAGEWRFAAQLEDNIILGPGDHQMPADGPAALRNDAADLDRSLDQNADGPRRQHPFAQD